MKATHGARAGKRIMILLLTSALFLLYAPSSMALDRILTPADGDMTVYEVVDIAKREVREMLVKTDTYIASLPYIAHFVLLHIDGVDEKVWVVAFFPHEEPGIVSAVTIQSPSGEILDRDTNHFWAFAETWEAWGDMDDYFFWSVEDKALYHALYQIAPTRLLPAESDVTQDAALKIATDTIQQRYGLSDEAIAGHRVDFNYVPNWYARQPHNAWIILLKPAAGTGSVYQVVLSALDGTVFTCDRNDEAYQP